MGPINYTLPDPGAAIIDGLNIGGGINKVQQDNEQRALAQQSALQQRADLQGLYANPNAGHAEYAAVMTKYPALAENLTKSYKVLDEGRKQTYLNLGSRVYGALQAGKPEIAQQLVADYAKADSANAKDWEVLGQVIKADPKFATMLAAQNIAALAGPEKFAETVGKLGSESRAVEQAPSDLRKKTGDADAAIADATIKGEQAKVAPQTVLLELEKKGWDIKKIKEDIDIAKQSNRIAAMNAATSRANSDIQREELKLKVRKAEDELGDKLRAKVAGAESSAAGIDNMLNTIERIKKNPSLDSVLGSFQGRMPSVFSDEASDAISLIETLGSQTFISQIPALKGTGSLSNAEGDKLQSALQNLSRHQSEKQFRENLDEAARLTLKARANISKASGLPLPKPDTPAAPGARPPLSAFEKP